MTEAHGAGPFTPGSVFAGYRILGVLGRGGMGIVYRAEDTRLGRQVALKVLSPHVAGDRSFRERFLREPRLLASIEHRNIVDVFHADQVDGVAFLAMRLIDGVDLGTMLRDRGLLEPAEVIHVVTEVADALDAAHRLNLIHRDVKPGNILAAANAPLAEARIYLTDFGLTKHNDAPTELTSTGQFVGTVDYVAPEQIQGSAIDGRADLYALACVAYECLSGRPPFHEARNAAALMAHLVTRPPDVTRLRPELPATVGAVLMKGMAKSRDERHATCSEFAAALAAALAGRGSVVGADSDVHATPTTSPPPPRSSGATPAWPPSASARPPEPTWATDRTIQMPVPAMSLVTHAGYPIDNGFAPGYRYEPDDAYETEHGVAPGRATRGRRRRSRIGAFLGTLALLGLGGAAVVLALALNRPGTAAPGGGATGSPGPRPSAPGEAVLRDRLRAQIPAQLRSQCTEGSASQPVLAVEECSIEDGRIRLVYSLFADTASMNAAYELVRSQLGVPANSGPPGSRCTNVVTWPNEGSYTVRDAPTGRLLCTFVAGQTRFEWTDRRVDVLTSATDTSGDGRRLFRLWRDGRLPPLATTTPEPYAAPSQAPPTDASAPATEPPAAPTEVPPTDPPAGTPVPGANDDADEVG